jgi:4-amino-4-deoxy-L-arabinose transferase-like glycosyltransferase
MRIGQKPAIACLICCAVAANLFIAIAWWPIALLIPFSFVASLKFVGYKRLLAFCSLFALGSAILLSFKNPYGGWDAKTFWNYQAAAFYSGDWRSTVDQIDHPLLIPAVIALVWKLARTPSPAVPAAIAIAFGIGVVVVVINVVRKARSTRAGLLAGIILLSAPTFVIQTSTQYADVPLAFFIVATIALIVSENYTLAGLAAGLSACTKNEGSLFVLAIVIAVMLVHRSLKQLSRIILGVAPMLALVVAFRLWIAPSNSVLNSTNIGIRLLDLHRYATILFAFAIEIFNIFDWGAAMLAMVFLPVFSIERQPRLKDPVKLGVVALMIMLAGYFTIYVITPYDLKLHLGTSLDRLFVQLLPSAVVLLFLTAKLPERLQDQPERDVQSTTEPMENMP